MNELERFVQDQADLLRRKLRYGAPCRNCDSRVKYKSNSACVYCTRYGKKGRD